MNQIFTSVSQDAGLNSSSEIQKKTAIVQPPCLTAGRSEVKLIGCPVQISCENSNRLSSLFINKTVLKSMKVNDMYLHVRAADTSKLRKIVSWLN